MNNRSGRCDGLVRVLGRSPDTGARVRCCGPRERRLASGAMVTSQATAAVTQPLKATIENAPESHDGRKKVTFELRFGDDLKQGFSFKTPRDHAFTVTGGKVVRAKRLEKDENVRWEIHVGPNSDVSKALADIFA